MVIEPGTGTCYACDVDLARGGGSRISQAPRRTGARTTTSILCCSCPGAGPSGQGRWCMPSLMKPGARYHTVAARTLFTGFYYIYIFPSLLYQLLKYRPDVIYCYEEAHTFIACCVLFLRRVFLPREPRAAVCRAEYQEALSLSPFACSSDIASDMLTPYWPVALGWPRRCARRAIVATCTW